MDDPHLLEGIEPERYEFREPPAYRFSLTRRAFIETLGAGIVVMVVVRDLAALAAWPDPMLRPAADPISAWLHIAEDGRVTVFTGKVEVGQDIRTSLTQAVAEELHVEPGAIRLVMGDTDLTPFDAGTFGSRSTPQMGTQLRRAAAAARSTMLQLAAQRWNVQPASLQLAKGRITETNGSRTVSIGELTRGERLVQEISEEAPTRSAAQWQVAGTSLPKVSGRDIVTGRHRFTSDMRAAGILFGKVLRAPAYDVSLQALDTRAAAAIPGVVVVHDGDFAGVAAPDEATAVRALAALRPQWSAAPAQPSHRNVFEHLRRTGQDGRANEPGSLRDGMEAADEQLEATYTTAYIAHVPLEPRAAFAAWDDDRLTVDLGTQRPFSVRAELARAFRIPEEHIRVRVPDTGSAYGGKHTGEVAVEAARLAHAARRPVRLVWTREEEFDWAYFRPAAVIDVRSGVHRDGTLTAWEFHNYNAGAAGIATVYEVPNQHILFHPSDSPLRQGSYRALAATANTFARETHMDELSARLGMDPLAFRLHNLKEPRLRAVLQAAASRFGWSDWRPTPGRGIGLACGSEKGGHTAACAEVSIEAETGRVRVTRILEAFECGAIVNPDGLRNQIEGCVVMGLGGALWESIEFEHGRILNGRLSQYRVPRLSDMPAIEIVTLNRPDLPSAGAGETPIIPVAPAIGNAIFRANGARLRALPLAPNGLANSMR